MTQESTQDKARVMGWEGHLKLKKNQCNLVLTKINLKVNGSFTYVLSHVDLGF
jgi:hypothetical protein